ncbi:MAG: dihydrolipoyl dehydrogenase, partial [Stenotrophomonas maltophilia]|nr:dihydrolipoyl dehydrogenase [Stenotrophomonas maltophilia]
GMADILHEAADDGRIAGDNAGRYPNVRPRPRRAPLGIVFSNPQITMAGATFRQLTESGATFEVGEASFVDQGRSRVMLENHGVIRVYADSATGTFLGAEMVGPSAEHIGHLLSWRVQPRDTVQQMIDSPFYHPVVEDGVRTALRQIQRKLVIPPPPPESCLDCLPGA